MKFLLSVYIKNVGAYAGNIGTHKVQHVTEILHMGLRCGITDYSSSGGQYGSHDDIFGCSYRRLIKKDISSDKLIRRQRI